MKKRNVYIKFDMPHLYTSITQDCLSCTCIHTHTQTHIPTHTITHTASNAAQLNMKKVTTTEKY